MSLSVTPNVNRTLPTADARPSSVIKRSEQQQEPVRADFAALVGSGAPAPASATVVTAEEKQFFASMFPAASDEIRSYAGYSPSGVKQPVQLGTLIDMKG